MMRAWLVGIVTLAMGVVACGRVEDETSPPAAADASAENASAADASATDARAADAGGPGKTLPVPPDAATGDSEGPTESGFVCGDTACDASEFCIEVHSGPAGGPASYQCGTMGACGGGCGCALASAPPGLSCALQPGSGPAGCGLIGGRPALVCSTQ